MVQLGFERRPTWITAGALLVGAGLSIGRDSKDCRLPIADCRLLFIRKLRDSLRQPSSVHELVYVAYSVVNESFASVDDSELFTGHLFRNYSKSRFLDYVGVATFASDDFPGKLRHYGVNCLNHFVDIVSATEPIISVIRDGPNKSDASGGSVFLN